MVRCCASTRAGLFILMSCAVSATAAPDADMAAASLPQLSMLRFGRSSVATASDSALAAVTGINPVQERINEMGRDLCKNRPDHPKCQQFTTTTTTPGVEQAVLQPVGEAAPAPAPAFVAAPAMAVPLNLNTWGRLGSSPTVPPPAEAPRLPPSRMTSWGEGLADPSFA
mmetsp:Transcript_93974/g.162680  ORF Transcript_93974/g.162680 Transcript_93974/m.162680 type:complete len:169 (-) Transcript_93974:84-590(-)